MDVPYPARLNTAPSPDALVRPRALVGKGAFLSTHWNPCPKVDNSSRETGAGYDITLRAARPRWTESPFLAPTSDVWGYPTKTERRLADGQVAVR